MINKDIIFEKEGFVFEFNNYSPTIIANFSDLSDNEIFAIRKGKMNIHLFYDEENYGACLILDIENFGQAECPFFANLYENFSYTIFLENQKYSIVLMIIHPIMKHQLGTRFFTISHEMSIKLNQVWGIQRRKLPLLDKRISHYSLQKLYENSIDFMIKNSILSCNVGD